MSFLVVALAIALRVAWVLAVPSKPVGDFAMYVESAAHLVEHGSFDSAFVYMPGYIFLIAPIQAWGGGWLATKLLGAVVGGLGAGAVIGITRRLSGGCAATALVAGLLYACWPAGIAIASVTGTDMPAAVLLTTAAYFLVRFSGRPLLAAILFGVFTGLAAYIRAIVVPLAALSLLVFHAQGATWRASIKAALVACVVALVMLSPWAIRNRLRYGETFLTDSHGGLTALVGANPNSDGCYSRSLNRMFQDVTGFTLLGEPHRDADRASLAIAKDWTTFSPGFTVGLLADKAERLLVHERALLYWPLFRAGVLPQAHQQFFARHRSVIEAVADAFWLCISALAVFGCALAYARKQWLSLALLPQAIALAALYTAIFSEPRYRLPIAMLALPLAASTLSWLARLAGSFMERPRLTWASRTWKREAILATSLMVGVLAAAPALAWTGQRLRERHRWAVDTCQVAGRTQFCKWRAVGKHTDGDSGIRGVWNGVGLAFAHAPPGGPSSTKEGTVEAAVETEMSLPPGNYVLSAALDVTPSTPDPAAANLPTDAKASVQGTIYLLANDLALPPSIPLGEVMQVSQNGQALPWNGGLRHPGGLFHLRLRIEAQAAPSRRVWLSDLKILPSPSSPAQR
jgi:4-amino-4-deoxy-L-arabinose transferase-like glycosyltransferase